MCLFPLSAQRSFFMCFTMSKNKLKATAPLTDMITIIPNRLYWTSLDNPPESSSTVHYFSIDDIFVYEPFYQDFGPLDLGCTYRYCRLVLEELNEATANDGIVVHYCSCFPEKRTNSVYLICAFQVIILNQKAADAFAPFKNIHPSLLDFRDASFGDCAYRLPVLHFLKGLELAIHLLIRMINEAVSTLYILIAIYQWSILYILDPSVHYLMHTLGWFSFDSFDLGEYEYYSQIENGDLNWIIPGKFIAFSSPLSEDAEEGEFEGINAKEYVGIFKKLNVTSVIRLNKQLYDRNIFVKNGIKHFDLYFADGSCPSRDIIQEFLRISEGQEGAIAVHCQAGLGRTGSLIGCYGIKKYRFPASYWIAWNRICRPGSVLGLQQYFLNAYQNELFTFEDENISIDRLPSGALPDTLEQQLTNLSIEENEKQEEPSEGKLLSLSKWRRSSLSSNLKGLILGNSWKSIAGKDSSPCSPSKERGQ
ncbi:serine/threonine specific protein phosphatase [Cardiosporidium cionae]|uniref:protein-tyrosine-phosphatase n=1 Tax=Cardiosporidium cionae TaxID=476202 RepID=A0ABQ7J939_9APIC|nr:serine/threonine specific protein phosphatase [Cardiosporidium cionae]|eukprot:KAF8820485.1 serine/threonine specific protein phosphatase [Cardiosporidium cionae]